METSDIHTILETVKNSLDVTEHSKDRAKERLGLDKKATCRLAKIVLEKGKKHGDFSGSFKRYLDKLYMSQGTANNMRVYGGYIYVFCDATLVTILEKPSRFRKVK